MVCMSRRRTVDTNQIVNIDLFRRAGLGMLRKKINKFFSMLVFFLN